MTISLDKLSLVAGEDMRRKDAAKERLRAEREAREREGREPGRARPKDSTRRARRVIES